MAPRTRPAPRRIPRQARSAATVAAIVEAAARVLEVDGLAGYTTNAVAARAGVSIGSLYQYFPDRDEITKALVKRQTAALLAEARSVVASATGRAALENLIEVAVQHQFRRPALARLLDVEEQRLPLTDDMLGVGDGLAKIVAICLGQAELAGSADSPQAAHDLLAIVRGIVDVAGTRHETDLEAVVRRVRRAVFGYLDYCE